MKDAQFAKLMVFVCSLVPAVMIAIDWAREKLPPDSSNYLVHTTGKLALIFLMLSLCITPLRKITGKNFWSLFRRMLGLYAFAYASAHLLIYFWRLQGWDWNKVFEDVFKRWYITLGMAAFLILIPLAATSTAAAVKRLGAKRWKLLHQMVYIAAIAAVFHYYISVKKDVTQPVAFMVVLGILLAIRFVFYLRSRQAKAREPAAMAGK